MGLVVRGLTPGQAILFALDGGKAQRSAITHVFERLASEIDRRWPDHAVAPDQRGTLPRARIKGSRRN